jgi:hypothetical protein
VTDGQANLPNPPSDERYDTKHVRMSADEGADGELLRVEDIKEFASVVLRIVGAALVMGSCALLVYLSAVLLARLTLWAFYF